MFCSCGNKINLIYDTVLINEAMQFNIINSLGLSKSEIGKNNYGEISYKYLEYIQEALPGRLAGTQKERETAVFILSALLDMGYTSDCIQVQQFPVTSRRSNRDWAFNGGEEIEMSQNIILTKKGESDKIIVIGAHYDCVETHGVDDNGSGVVAVLESAMRMIDEQMPYTLKYIFFGYEETQTVGSANYVKSLSRKEKNNIVAMINIDSIIGGDTLYISGGKLKGYDIDSKNYKELRLNNENWTEYLAENGTVIEDWAAVQAYGFSQKLGLDIRWQTEEYNYFLISGKRRTDYLPFSEVGIPYIHFEAFTWNSEDCFESEKWGTIIHFQNDDLDFINCEFPGRAKKALAEYSVLLEYILKNLSVNDK
jgi:hypothetical protein